MADPISIASSLVSTAHTATKLRATLGQTIKSSALKQERALLVIIRNRLAIFGSLLDSLVSAIASDHSIMPAHLFSDLQDILEASSRVLQKLVKEIYPDGESQVSRKFMILRKRPEVEACDKLLQDHVAALQLMLRLISMAKTQQVGRVRVSAIDDTEQADTERSSSPVSIHPPGAGRTSNENQFPRLDSTLATEQHSVNDYIKRVGYKHGRYFGKLNFEEQPVYHICIQEDNQISVDIPKIEPFDIGLLQSTSPHVDMPPRSDPLQDSNKMTLILCEATTAVASSVPFKKQVFVMLMKRLGIPPGLFQALFTGTPKSVYYGAGDNNPRAGFVLRAPMSRSEDWTLALSWAPDFRALKGIVHGMQRHEMSRLAMYIGDTRAETAHPMNIPVILCEMLIESDSNGVKGHALELYQVELSTTYHGYPGNESADPDNLTTSPKQNFEEMTRSLNTIISRLAFHEMRIHANGVFADQIMERIRLINESMRSRDPDQRGSWLPRLRSMSERVLERLYQLKIEQRALLLEISCNQKIAQSQLEIVYNLVAQRDNKDNLNMATISTDIAKTTKDDSSAMRTIAVMSIAFLPGTFVSSFFSMDMFDWQAPKGASVLSFRFWIYWAVTAPLTLVVFCIWFFWLRVHREHDDQGGQIGTVPRTHYIRAFREQSSTWTKWAKIPRKDEEKQAVEDEQVTNPSIVAVPPESVVRSRALTSQVARADTVLQGPRR